MMNPLAIEFGKAIAGNWLSSILATLPVKVYKRFEENSEMKKDLQSCIDAAMGVFIDQFAEVVNDNDVLVDLNSSIIGFFKNDDALDEWVKLVDPKIGTFPDFEVIKRAFHSIPRLNSYRGFNIDAVLQNMVQAYKEQADRCGSLKDLLTQKKLNEIQDKLDQFLAKNDVRMQFEKYCDKRLKEFADERLYGDDFSLYDIYVYSNCKHYIYNDRIAHNSELEKIKSKSIKDTWKNCIQSDNITLLLGGPGLGKSSFTKALFRDVLKEQLNLLPYHVRLKNIEYLNSFRESILKTLKGDIQSFEAADFKGLDILLILDGFDELAQLAKGDLNAFFHSLIRFHEEFKRVKIFITGRPTALAGLTDAIPTGSNMLSLDNFNNEQIDEWLQKWVELNRLSKYPLTSEDVKNRNINELASQPLLLYLLCKMDKDGEAGVTIGEMATWERWQFYGKLMDWTCGNAKWRDKEDYNPLKEKGIDKEKLKKVVREVNRNIALSMFHTDKWDVTCSEIEERDLFPTHLCPEITKEEYSYVIKTMLVQSYMNPVHSEAKERYAFEYTHKSFAEYLVAEALVECLKEIQEQKEDYNFINKLADIFYTSFCGFNVFFHVNTFLFALIKNFLDCEKIYERLQKLYYEFYIEHEFLNDFNCGILADYFKKYPEKNSVRMELEFNSGCNLLNLLVELGVWLNKPFKVNRDGINDDLYSLLYFLKSYGYYAPDYFNLNGTDLSNSDLIGVDLHSINLSDAVLKGAHMQYSNLVGVGLAGTDISYVNLFCAYMIDADLSGAILKGAILEGAFLIGADLENIRIDRATYEKYLDVLKQGNNFDKIIVVDDEPEEEPTDSE